MKSFIKPGTKGSLISAGAQAELERQDKARAIARASASSTGFRDAFARTIGYELELATKWGAEADVAGDPPTVVRSIRDKYPPRKPGKFLTWLFQFRMKSGLPIFQYNPAPRGLIVNEGGRVTLTMTKPTPFQLVLFGVVFRYRRGFALYRKPKPWSGLRKMLKWTN